MVSKERGGPYRAKKILRHREEGDMIVEEQEVRRGEIYHADLNPVFGSEQGGYRPVLIIQNNRGKRIMFFWIKISSWHSSNHRIMKYQKREHIKMTSAV